MTEAKRGYWDVEACRWVGAEATYVMPPVSSFGAAGRDEPTASVPTPRSKSEAEPSSAAPRTTVG